MSMQTRKRKNFGITEIAKLAGVSTATVSRVLNSPEKASPETRKKILDIITENGYVPNSSTNRVLSSIANSIAIFAHDLANPLDISIFRHLNRIATEKNYMLIICGTENNYKYEEQYYEYLSSIHTKGIIYMAGTSREKLAMANQSPFYNTSVPIVLFDRASFTDSKCYVVKSNHAKGMSMLVDYLYNLNHTKIGYITGSKDILSTSERLNGFLASMKKLNLEVRPEFIVDGSFSTQSGRAAFDHFYSLPDSPTAIIAANDLCAKGFIMRASSLGVKIPEEFSICGYNGVDLESFYPAITSVKQNPEQIAQSMIDLIINASKNPPPVEVIIDVSFLPGDTCLKITPTI